MNCGGRESRGLPFLTFEVSWIGELSSETHIIILSQQNY